MDQPGDRGRAPGPSGGGLRSGDQGNVVVADVHEVIDHLSGAVGVVGAHGVAGNSAVNIDQRDVGVPGRLLALWATMRPSTCCLASVRRACTWRSSRSSALIVMIAMPCSPAACSMT